MELEYSIWLVGLMALVAGTLIGALAYRYFAPSIKQADKVKSELVDAREELNNYKAGVTQHFDKTAELVNDLAQNYVKVYQHLADGAQSLGASKSFKDLMEQHQGKVAIAVDDSSVTTETVDDNPAVEPVVEQEEVVGAPIDYVDPGVETTTNEVDAEASQNESARTDVSESPPEPEDPVKAKDSDQDLDTPEEDADIKNQPDRLQ